MFNWLKSLIKKENSFELTYDPNRHYHLNASLLVIATIFGIILGTIYQTAVLVLVIPALSQFQWLIDLFKRVIFVKEISALDRLTNSASLADIRDNYTKGRYRDSVIYRLQKSYDDTHYLLYINANGIKNTRHLSDLSEEVGAAFHSPAYLQDISNGYVVYWIDLTKSRKVKEVNESDF